MRMKKCLGRLFWLGMFGVICVPPAVSATELSIQSDTLLRVFQRDTATENDAAVTPIYEYLRVDMDTPDEPGLAFHLYGWGRGDLTDNDYFEDATTGELLYGYLEYSHKNARFNARLGRQYVFEGVANESVDGLRLSSDLGRYFSGSLYAGQQVPMTLENGRSGDSTYGGRLAHHLAGQYDLGLSYKKIRNDGDDAEELAGVDLSAYLPFGINVYGFSAYNVDTNNWGEHSFELRANLGPVSVRPYFQKFQYEDYFSAGINSANPFRFLAGSGEELTIFGTDLTLPVGEAWVLVGKAKNYDYKVFDDTSQYYSAQAIWSGEKHTQVGGEFGYMKGDAAQNDYYLVRAYTYWDKVPAGCPVGFVSGDVVYIGYDEAIYGEDSSLFISLAAGKKFLADEALELKLSGDYSSDPYFDNDLRGMLIASYRFGRTL